MSAMPAMPLSHAAFTPTKDSLLRPTDVALMAGEMSGAVAVLPRLQALLQAEQTSISDIVDLVLIDPNLTVRLTQAAASANFGGSTPACGLADALFRLGADEVYRVTATFELGGLLNRQLHSYGFGPTEFWRRALACALALVNLAASLGLDQRRAYTVGLLHSIGMLFIDRHLRSVGAPELRLGAVPAEQLPATEIRLVGLNHAEVAACALRTWGFADDIAEPIEYQLRPADAPHQRVMASLLAQARVIAADVVSAVSPPAVGEPTGSDWCAALGAQVLHVGPPPA